MSIGKLADALGEYLVASADRARGDSDDGKSRFGRLKAKVEALIGASADALAAWFGKGAAKRLRSGLDVAYRAEVMRRELRGTAHEDVWARLATDAEAILEADLERLHAARPRQVLTFDDCLYGDLAAEYASDPCGRVDTATLAARADACKRGCRSWPATRERLRLIDGGRA